MHLPMHGTFILLGNMFCVSSEDFPLASWLEQVAVCCPMFIFTPAAAPCKTPPPRSLSRSAPPKWATIFAIDEHKSNACNDVYVPHQHTNKFNFLRSPLRPFPSWDIFNFVLCHCQPALGQWKGRKPPEASWNPSRRTNEAIQAVV
jgi:hypothetical protein